MKPRLDHPRVYQMTRLLIKFAAVALGGWAFYGSTGQPADAAVAESGATIQSKVSCFAIKGFDFCNMDIKISGEINFTSAEWLESYLHAAKVSRAKIISKTLWIDSPGGDVGFAIAMGTLLRENRVAISVAKGAQCASACVLIFAGAVRRTAFGKIGIHRPYLISGSQPISPENVQRDYGAMLGEMRAYLRTMNVSQSLADDMLKIAPSEMRYLSQDGLNNYSLGYVDPVEQETDDLEEARRYGLDRSEYIRRQAIQKIKCSALAYLESIPCEERVMKTGM